MSDSKENQLPLETTSDGGIDAKTQIKSDKRTEDNEEKSEETVVAAMPTTGKSAQVEMMDMDIDDDEELDPRKQQWSESLKARLFGSADKDGNFFSFMFLDKIFGEARPCIHCSARGTAKVPPGDSSLQLYVIEEGIIGSQNIMCEKCGKLETVVSGDDPSLMPQDPRLIIKGAEIREICRKITHYEVLHDLMEMLHIAAMDDNPSRKEKHYGVAAFLLQNTRKICEEWCRPEHAELRLRKYLRLREETLLTKYKPTFTPDCTEEFKEMYEMMAQSFRQNRNDILTVLQLLKESLIDSPSRSNFMMWVGMAMMHSENFPQFKQLYDPRSFMRVESQEYQAIQDRYLTLDAPVGIKKIPIIFVLFEIPRFYHYVDFLNKRLGKRKPRLFLTDSERAELKVIEEEAARSGVGRAARRRGKKTKTMVSPEAHLDFLTQQEDLDRERVYQSCREKKHKAEAENALGMDLPRAIQSTSYKPKKTQKDMPLPITASNDKVEKSVDSEEAGLSKAQIKRRRKKAMAASEKAAGGKDGIALGAAAPKQAVTEDKVTGMKSSKDVAVARETGSVKGKENKKEDRAHVTERNTAGKAVVKDVAGGTLGSREKAADPKDKTKEKEISEAKGKGLSPALESSPVTRAGDSPPAPVQRTDPPTSIQDVLERVAEVAGGGSDEEELSVERIRILEQLVRSMDLDVLKEKLRELDSDSDLEADTAESLVPAKPLVDYVRVSEVVRESPLAEAECANMEDLLLTIVSENSMAMYLPERVRRHIVRNLAAVSYPMVAALLEFSNSLAAPISELSTGPKRISVLIDPFNVYNDPANYEASMIAFIKTKDKVRPPLKRLMGRVPRSPAERAKAEASKPDKAKQNIQDTLQARLAEVMTESMVDIGEEKEMGLNLNWYSLECSHLPPCLEKVVNGERGETVVPFNVPQADFKLLYEAVQQHGVLHSDVRHRDTETLTFFPGEQKLDDCIIEELSRNLENDPEIGQMIRQVEREVKRREATKRSTEAAFSHAGKTPYGASKATPPGYEMFDMPKEPKGRNASRRAKREALKNAKKTLKDPTGHQAIMVTQMDTEILRRQGYTVDTRYPKATVVANRDGAIIHVLDGQQTPAQVKEFLSKRYSIVAQQAGPGYVTMPTKDHPGGLLVDPSTDDIPSDKFSGNRKKQRGKKKAIHEKQASSLTRWPVPRPKNPYSIPLGLWATQDYPWPEGLDYGTEYHSDREIICESDDEDLVKAIDKDEFGNHSMLMRLELSTVDVPDEKAAESVMTRYMEPADLGPGIDPKVPRYIIPSNGVTPSTNQKLPAGTTKRDIPFLMKYAAPHKQMRAMDAMKIPYKYELTQVLTPHLNKEGEVVPDAPKRIALMSKITLLPKSRYRSLNPQPEEKEAEKEEESKVEEEEMVEEDVPKISKSQRKKMKKKQKLVEQGQDSPLPHATTESLDPDEVVHSKLHHPPQDVGAELDDSSEEQRAAARLKLKFCDNCGQEILTKKVYACAGCKQVAYCNFRCQKSSWKVHKKTCPYALRKDEKESTG